MHVGVHRDCAEATPPDVGSSPFRAEPRRFDHETASRERGTKVARAKGMHAEGSALTRRSRTIDPLPPIVAVIFAGAIGAMGWLWHYKSTPGPQGDAPARWPRESAVPAPAHVPTLILFAHPRCPCTRASLSELRAVMSGRSGQVTAFVLMALPARSSRAWTETDAWATAASIPGVTVLPDPDEAEARRFGARTSGHVVVYGRGGELRFAGGITAARGHIGANDGEATVTALVDGSDAGARRSPVFGCALGEGEESR